MEGLLRVLLANAFVAGLLAAVAWVAARRLRRQAVVHGLWLLALVKLVTPPLVPLPLVPSLEWPTLVPPSRSLTVVVIEPRSSVKPAPETPMPRFPERPVPEHVPAASLRSPGLETQTAAVWTELPTPVGQASALPDRASLAAAGLLVGALVVAGLASRRIRRFCRLLRDARPAPGELESRTAVLARRVGLRRAPPLRLLSASVPPMLWPGRRGPLLLLPTELLPRLSEEERDALLVHELAHVRRRDHWVRFLELAVTVVFWWYPVAWWVRHALRRAEERCCDEWVLRLMPGSAHAYAQGLLKSLAFVAGEPDPLPAGASGAGPVHDLEARLKEILMTRPTTRLAAPVRLTLAAAALSLLAVFPTRAQSPSPEAEPARAGAEETAPVAPAAPVSPVAPAPAPRPVVAPAPAPRPVAAPAPAARPAVALAPEPPEGPPATAPRDPIQEQELEHEHRKLEAQRAELHRRELDLARQSLELEAQREQQELRAEAARLRARGEPAQAARLEERAGALARRLDVQRRQLELEHARLAEQMAREQGMRAKVQQIEALEREGREAEAERLRIELERAEEQGMQETLEREKQQVALEREALEAEHRARLAERDAAREAFERDRVAMETDLERAREQQERELADRQRELEARAMEQAQRAKEIEARSQAAAGRTAEAERARAEAAELRGQAEEKRLRLHREQLRRAIADLERELEVQLEALGRLKTDGVPDAAGLEPEIRRLEAALAALRGGKKR